ncbi:substrate-binding domain-containing protein [Streptomyces fuscichromogenes]|uniref:substrate-binding domain-containing protein n=1 Tax=Streptomyces fuscichromogenes TaxID=1324013 RepID=UPI00382D5449
MSHHLARKVPLRAVAIASVAVATTFATGCTRGSETTGSTAAASSKSGCPTVLAKAKATVKAAENVNAPWTGPTTGPEAVPGKTIVYVAQSMTNPGVAGAADGVKEAAKAIGWKVRVIDGQGTPAGIQAALSQAVAVKPDGIVLSGFDPKSTAQQVAQANTAGIPLIGWHAVDAPGSSTDPKLFSNITTKVEEVAKISADWVITQSNGRGGVVVFTDASIPFAKGKSDLIAKELATCSDVKLLTTSNIPIADASSRTPQEVSALLNRYGTKWTNSVAINDLYFADAAPALRAAGKQGDAAPFNIGAGDGDPSAFQRINSKEFQSATVPEPLSEQGWQMVDEFNRAFAGKPASGYVAPAHITTSDNSGSQTSWDPAGYRDAYRKLWGK